MTRKIRMPGDIDIPIQLFGQFTVKELARLSIPPATGLALASVQGLVAGLLLGTVWYLWKPYGYPVDHHVYHLPRWLIGKRQLQGSDIGEFDQETSIIGVDSRKIKNRHGSLIGVLRVEPTNLDLKTGDEKAALHNIYQELLESVNYPVQVHSLQDDHHLESYLSQIQGCSTSDEVLKDDYLEYCSSLSDLGLVKTQHLVTVRVDPSEITSLPNQVEDLVGKAPSPVEKLVRSFIDDSSNGEWEQAALAGELDSRCREVVDALNTAELSVERVTGSKELEEVAYRVDLVEPDTSPTWVAQGDSAQYFRTLYLSEYPSTVEFGWINQLLQIRGKVDVTQVVQPQDTGKTVKRLQRLSEKLNAEINSFLASGYTGTNKLEALLEDVQWFLDLLAERKAKPVKYGCYITVHSESKQRCQQVFDQVCNRLDTMRFDYQQPVLRTDHAYKSTNPLYADTLDESLLMPASSAASGFPFTTQQSTESGVLHGIDTGTGAPVLLDRFNWSSHSLARMGTVGSGKSYKSKLELLRSHLVYDDLQIVVVDPKQEYKRVVEVCDGDYRVLNGQTVIEFDEDVMGYTVSERGDEENVKLLVDAVRQIYQEVSQDTRKTLVLIDEARILLNDPDGLDVLNQFVLEGRDTNTAVTLVTQNASHFTHSRKGREILDNMPAKEFMRHDRVPDSVVKYFDLSRREKQKLFELKTGNDSDYGEALVRVAGRLKTRVKVESTPQEGAVIEVSDG